MCLKADKRIIRIMNNLPTLTLDGSEIWQVSQREFWGSYAQIVFRDCEMCGRAPLCNAFINISTYRSRNERAITEIGKGNKEKGGSLPVYSVLYGGLDDPPKKLHCRMSGGRIRYKYTYNYLTTYHYALKFFADR